MKHWHPYDKVLRFLSTWKKTNSKSKDITRLYDIWEYIAIGLMYLGFFGVLVGIYFWGV